MALKTFLLVKCSVCTGGTSLQENMAQVRIAQQLVIGTPARILDFIQKRVIKTEAIKLILMDQAEDLFSSYVERICIIH